MTRSNNLAIPFQIHPRESFYDIIFVFFGRPSFVSIFNTQMKSPPVFLGKKPIVQGGLDRSNMHKARRRRRNANPHVLIRDHYSNYIKLPSNAKASVFVGTVYLCTLPKSFRYPFSHHRFL